MLTWYLNLDVGVEIIKVVLSGCISRIHSWDIIYRSWRAFG